MSRQQIVVVAAPARFGPALYLAVEAATSDDVLDQARAGPQDVELVDEPDELARIAGLLIARATILLAEDA